MTPTTATPDPLTADEFAQRYASARAELVRGQVVETPMPTARHGQICYRAARYFGTFIEDHDLGHVMTNDSFIRTQRGPDSVRGADLCYFSFEHLPRGPVPDGLLPVQPELVIEVRSPSDRPKAITAKVDEYLQAGVRVVLVIDPELAAATVHRADELPQTFHNGDTLTLPDVLPGFELPLAKLFA